MSERFSKLIADHPLRIFLVTTVMILLTADAGGLDVSDEDLAAGVLTWVAVGLIALGVIETLVAPHLVAAGARLGVAWALGLTPFVFGFAALMAGSPIQVMWLGALISICLTALVAFVFTRPLEGDPRP